LLGLLINFNRLLASSSLLRLSGGVNLKLVTFGDSITAGVLVDRKDNFSYLIEEITGIRVINSGVPGNNTAEAVRRIEKDVLLYKPSFVTIGFGMNDHYLTDLNTHKVSDQDYSQNMIHIINLIRDIQAVPLLFTLQPIIEGDQDHYYYSRHNCNFYKPFGGANKVLSLYNKNIYTLAQKTETILVDVYAAFLQALKDGYTLDDLLVSLKNSTQADGVHLSKKGHLIYASQVVKSLSIHLNCEAEFYKKFALEKNSSIRLELLLPGTYIMNLTSSSSFQELAIKDLVQINGEGNKRNILQKGASSSFNSQLTCIRIFEVERPEILKVKALTDNVVGKIGLIKNN